jgi:hypothetical protein
VFGVLQLRTVDYSSGHCSQGGRCSRQNGSIWALRALAMGRHLPERVLPGIEYGAAVTIVKQARGVGRADIVFA